ncbi:MAG: phosphoenolpyruvate--protein phosphotransferase [Burkholderiales bacterium]|nr:phosphoenolpyruvate--protein phosphotransferase [Burkholderiales bacterium]OUT80027.1 MAG: phosphoenolpyruvate--protein phosphotransferase [Betaproteobacteria bacterium TMED22]
MSFTIHGAGVSGGIAIGRAQLASHALLEVTHYAVQKNKIKSEKIRFDRAIKTVRKELNGLKKQLTPDIPEAEFEAFINLHKMILEDSTLSEAPKNIIESLSCNAEWALKVQLDKLIEQFSKIEDTYLRERKADVRQVAERILKVLLGRPGSAATKNPEENTIIVAHDLSPTDVVLFKQHKFAAFITDLGGATSHTTIVARSLNIPSVVALHQARTLIRENELIIVDGTAGVVIVNPDEIILSEYEVLRKQWLLAQQKLRRLRRNRATTIDGADIELIANIELPEDVSSAKENGATGVGLFRTEFLFLNRGDLPSEDEQFEAYRQVVRDMKNASITIRTFDLGSDKQPEGYTRVAPNPALGQRAIRLCLAEPRLFHHQLRAILRASKFGKIRILIPMLSNIHEIDQALHLIAEAKDSLDIEGAAYDREIEIGGMIEVPAAALSINAFLKKLDFVSIGTNDLIQYTLAIDRTDDAVAHLYDPMHPAILQLLSHIISSANRLNKSVAVCGEIAGDPSITRLLLGMGLRTFSMHPAQLLPVKQKVLTSDLRQATSITKKILKAQNPMRVEDLITQLNTG